ncbi:hypothetical protein FSS13T_15440 [Flavobacterium saliperosum S13]|uniref:Uncharacterized protein n=1 Tax=Flavobacterium saliperosum S13 TaxID=1341155 RepID=A0ABP3A2W6_9FLAO|nr:hypothetical protein FSS13T_15440 [Flavobacterium saliperosum S13]
MGELRNLQYIIKLEPGVFELETMTISNVKPDPNAIMAEVKKNLPIHYKNNGQASKSMIFYRDASTFKPIKFDIEFTKSTGFTKKGLEAVNREVNAFTSKLISHPPKEFKDLLCNYYTNTKMKDNKPLFHTKLDVVKATLLKDEDRSVDLDDMQQVAENIFLKHLDSTKYYRVKSGLFGSRDTISLKKSFNEKKNKNKNITPKLTSSKTGLTVFMFENNFSQSGKLDFVNKPELYKYTYEGKTYNDKDEFMYVLSFEPRKSKAKYNGKLYVSETDYAVVRCDYALAEGETVSGFNMKLLLGVKASENISKGTLIYKKNTDNKGYYLQYASVETGQYIYLNRPLKFIELTDSEKDVVAFDLKVEGNTADKKEFLTISKSEINETAFDNVKEEDFNYILLKRYDSKIWKDFVSIEPLEEMKQFKVAE